MMNKILCKLQLHDAQVIVYLLIFANKFFAVKSVIKASEFLNDVYEISIYSQWALKLAFKDESGFFMADNYVQVGKFYMTYVLYIAHPMHIPI